MNVFYGTRAQRPGLGTRSAVKIGMLTMIFGLSGCSYTPDWANPVEWYESASADNASRPAKATMKDAGAPIPGQKQAFPNLSSVPERPAGTSAKTQERATEGLLADRDKARYTDEQLRADTSVQPPVSPPSPPAKARTTSPAPATVTAPAKPALPKVSQMAQASTAPTPGSSPTPMIAAMTRQRLAGKGGKVPSMNEIRGQTQTVVPATVSKPDTTIRLQPNPQPAYPTVQPPPVQGGDILTSTFLERLRASGATVTTAPASPAYIGSVQTATAAPAPATGSMSLPLAAAQPELRGAFAPLVQKLATIRFANGSAKIGSAGLKFIRSVVAAYKAQGGIIRVVGHSSSRTKDMPIEKHKIVNFNISLLRAQNVAKALARRGVPIAQIVIEAKGDSEPLYFEAMPRGEAENRRVEIFLEK